MTSACGEARWPIFSYSGPVERPGRVGGDDEVRQALGRAREDEVDGGEAAVRDHRLAPVEHPAVAVGARADGDPVAGLVVGQRVVAAGGGLGDGARGREAVVVRDPVEHPRLPARREPVDQAAEAPEVAEEVTDAEVAGCELLGDEAERDGVRPAAAVLGPERQRLQPEPRAGLDHVPGELVERAHAVEPRPGGRHRLANVGAGRSDELQLLRRLLHQAPVKRGPAQARRPCLPRRLPARRRDRARRRAGRRAGSTPCRRAGRRPCP